MIDNPTSCKIPAVIRFHHARNMSAAEIHHELCMAVYDQGIMSEGAIRQWCRMFRDGQIKFTMKSKVRDELVQSVCQKICEKWCSTFSELSC
jgi:hypothetical protein